MTTHTTNQSSRIRLTLGIIGLCLGGLAPLITGLVGVWGYVTRGYFISKTGEVIDGPLAIMASGVFILVGLGMIGYAIWIYGRRRQRDK